MDQFSPSFLEFSIFFGIPFFVEVVLPKWILHQVNNMGTLAVEILKWIRAWLTLLCFKSRWVDLSVSFAIPGKFPMIIGTMGTIALSAFRSLNVTDSCWVTPLLAIFTLRDARVHVGTFHCSNNVSDIESSVDDFSSVATILVVPNIDPDNCHIQLGRDFNNVWSWCKDDVVEDMIIFEDVFDILRGDMCARIVNVIWNAYDFKVRLWLGKSGRRYSVVVIFE